MKIEIYDIVSVTSPTTITIPGSALNITPVFELVVVFTNFLTLESMITVLIYPP